MCWRGFSKLRARTRGFGRSATRYSSASRRHVAFLGTDQIFDGNDLAVQWRDFRIFSDAFRHCRGIETLGEVRLIKYPTTITTPQPTML